MGSSRPCRACRPERTGRSDDGGTGAKDGSCQDRHEDRGGGYRGGVHRLRVDAGRRPPFGFHVRGCCCRGGSRRGGPRTRVEHHRGHDARAITYCFAILRADRGLDAAAPLVGLGILLLGELLDLARAGGEGRMTDRAVWSGRTIFVLAVAAGGAATAQFALLIGGSARGTGPFLLFLAVLASVIALIAILRLVRSLMTPSAESGAATSGDEVSSRGG